MTSLKDLRNRKKSVQATQKITSAMKMVAGAKLRRFQAQRTIGEKALNQLQTLLSRLLSHLEDLEELPSLLQPIAPQAQHHHLVVLLTSDRGLCGYFNNQLIRAAKLFQQNQQQQGQQVGFFCLGRKGYENLNKNPQCWVVEGIIDLGKPLLKFEESQNILQRIFRHVREEKFGHVTLIYNKFKNVMTQELTFQPLLPIQLAAAPEKDLCHPNSLYLYEPSYATLLENMLPFFLGLQLYQAMLESGTSEQGARMTAMDSATRNAADMIKKLTLTYNRTRQAYITRELIEIISGAEAL